MLGHEYVRVGEREPAVTPRDAHPQPDSDGCDAVAADIDTDADTYAEQPVSHRAAGPDPDLDVVSGHSGTVRTDTGAFADAGQYADPAADTRRVVSTLSVEEIRGAPWGGQASPGQGTFEEFVTGTAGRLLRTAVFLVYDRHLAEDLVQMTYERVARRWSRIGRSAHPEAYARKVLVNLAIDDRKWRARRRDLPFGSIADLEQIAGRAEAYVTDGLDDALAGLPAKQRAVVVLRYWCDLSEQEIAETLGISRGTVKSHTARAMTALRQTMVREGRDE